MKNILEATETNAGYTILYIVKTIDNRFDYIGLVQYSVDSYAKVRWTSCGATISIDGENHNIETNIKFSINLQSEYDILVEKCKNVDISKIEDNAVLLSVVVLPEEYWERNEGSVVQVRYIDKHGYSNTHLYSIIDFNDTFVNN